VRRRAGPVFGDVVLLDVMAATLTTVPHRSTHSGAHRPVLLGKVGDLPGAPHENPTHSTWSDTVFARGAVQWFAGKNPFLSDELGTHREVWTR
jgi:hypothetical protein